MKDFDRQRANKLAEDLTALMNAAKLEGVGSLTLLMGGLMGFTSLVVITRGSPRPEPFERLDAALADCLSLIIEYVKPDAGVKT